MQNQLAGVCGALFSLMNLFARSWGGILSDYLAAKKGLPGRIFGMWIIQVFEGIMCILLGVITLNHDSPDEPKYDGMPKVNSTWTDSHGNNWHFPQPNLQVPICGSALQRTPTQAMLNGVMTTMPMQQGSLIMMHDPAPNCIHAQNTLGSTI